ncbi:AMP-binding protein [Varibaculum massiliense]|uniref:AMP-binding protein n=1 Tax=Varibaculum massiliense TaxID=1852372 RepID=UPI0013564FF9|nr:AMP-binding protein [Varibaculum massiliense]
MALRIVPSPSTDARAASEVLAPQSGNSNKDFQIDKEENAPQIIWLQSEPNVEERQEGKTTDSASRPRPLIFLPVSDNPARDTLFFTALRAALWPDKFTSLPTLDLSAVAGPAKPFFALRILADYHPIFFPARTEQLSRSWARQQALRLQRLPDQVSFILSTSGSTKPGGRLVGLSLAALRASHQATAQRLGENGIWVSALPRDHIAGFQVIARAYAGGTEPVTIDMTGGFKLSRLRQALQNILSAGVPIYLSLVPTQLTRALADPETLAALHLCSAILVGGARISPSLLNSGREQGLNLVTTYGMTETCGGCVYDGVPLPGVKVGVNEGRIWLSTPTLMSGYLEAESDPEIRELSGITWLATNDAGRIIFEDEDASARTGDGALSAFEASNLQTTSSPLTDPTSNRSRQQKTSKKTSLAHGSEDLNPNKPPREGTVDIIDSSSSARLEVLGRLDDTIISGGENISLPLVARAAEDAGFAGIEFCGLPDEEWGQVLCAVFAKPTLAGTALASHDLDSENLDPAHLGSQLRAALRGSLPASHLPRAAAIVSNFPLLPSGKLDRRSLQEAARSLDKEKRTWRK